MSLLIHLSSWCLCTCREPDVGSVLQTLRTDVSLHTHNSLFEITNTPIWGRRNRRLRNVKGCGQGHAAVRFFQETLTEFLFGLRMGAQGTAGSGLEARLQLLTACREHLHLFALIIRSPLNTCAQGQGALPQILPLAAVAGSCPLPCGQAWPCPGLSWQPVQPAASLLPRPPLGSSGARLPRLP